MTEPRTAAGRQLVALFHSDDEAMTRQIVIDAVADIEYQMIREARVALDVERLARALMIAAANGDRPITVTAQRTADRVAAEYARLAGEPDD